MRFMKITIITEKINMYIFLRPYQREVCTYVYLHLLVLKIHPTLKVITEKGFYEMLAIFITQMKQEINFCFYVHLIFILIIHELIIKG